MTQADDDATPSDAAPDEDDAMPSDAAPPAPEPEPEGRGAVLWAYGVSVVLIALAGYPGVAEKPRDSYPFSNYPMFSKARSENLRVKHVVAMTKGGDVRPVPPDLVVSDEVMQAKVTIRNAIRRKGEASKLCVKVAESIRAEPDWSDMTWVKVRTDTYNVLDWAEGRRDPKASKVHATCLIKRP